VAMSGPDVPLGQGK